MKNKTILITCLIFAVVFSCKKKDDEPDTVPTGTGTTTGGSTTGTVPTGTATSFNGFLTVTNSTVNFAGLGISSTAASAFFSSQPVSTATGTGLTVQSVFLNGDSLISAGTGNYSRITGSPGVATWSVNGANGIPSFTYTNNNPMPSGSDLNAVPVVISKAAGFQFSINNVQNMHTGNFVMTDGSGNLAGTIIMQLKAGNNAINFSSSQLSGMNTGTTGIVMITLENATGVNLGGKNFSFRKSVQLMKQIEIKP